MKLTTKICIFALLTALLLTLFSVSVFATDADVNAPVDAESVEQNGAENGASIKTPHRDLEGKDLSFAERFEFVLVGFATGMLAVFAILALLWGIISLSKVFLYDIPNAKRNKKIKRAASAPAVVSSPVEAEMPAAVEKTDDDGELAAVITAAIAAMIESGDYKDEFVGGFRVVSFKRSAKSAWNRK